MLYVILRQVSILIMVMYTRKMVTYTEWIHLTGSNLILPCWSMMTDASGCTPEPGRNPRKNWGVLFTDGRRKKLITAEEARAMRRRGQYPGPGAVLTPLAKEIMEGS